MGSTAPEASTSRRATFVFAMLAVNLALFVAAVGIYARTGSQLVLAQGFDSLLDVASGIILAVTVWVGARPRDANHPYGHERAEPIGALITAILAGVLAFEILRSSISALVSGEVAQMELAVAGILGGKFLLKALLLVALRLRASGDDGPALSALRVDARNDLFACGSSLVGYGLARAGNDWADAALALPVALYIAANGFQLARENLRYLMGEAPDEEVLAELRALAREVPGVIAVGRLRAQFAGPVLHVEVDVEIGAGRSATQGHEIAVRVQHELEGHELVGHVYVHVDTEETHGGS